MPESSLSPDLVYKTRGMARSKHGKYHRVNQYGRTMCTRLPVEPDTGVEPSWPAQHQLCSQLACQEPR